MISRYIRLFVVSAFLFSTTLAFQNCSSQFQAMDQFEDSLNMSSSAAPTIIFSNTPAYFTTSSVTLNFQVQISEDDTLQSVSCQIGDNLPINCISGSVTTNNLLDNNYSLRIVAISALGGQAEATQIFRKDTTPPTVTVSSAPAAVSNSTSASFVFVASDNLSGVSTLECSLDTAAYAACVSPLILNNLSSGQHRMRIRGVDVAGNITASIYDYQWTINTQAPTVNITAAPAPFVNTTNASLTFSGTGIVSYECQINNNAWESCTSPRAYSNLQANTAHTFRVRGTNSLGTVSAATSAQWTIDTVAPTVPSIMGNVPAITNSRGASLSFTSSDTLSGVNRYECSINSAAYATCASPRMFSNLVDAQHSLAVRTIDNASNTSSVSTFSWRVDGTAPTLSFSQTPQATTTNTSATFAFSASDGANGSGLGSTQCSLGTAAFANCTSPVSLTNLTIGIHQFRVRVTDNASNSTTITHNWTITTSTPDPGSGNLMARMTATRVSGPAPLAVLFDATDTTGGTGVDAFRELTYSFDFGDNRGETWAVSGQNKNTQVGGPIASHIFNVPGEYTVRLRATNAAGAFHETTVNITVQDPNTVYSGQNTVCVSTSGNYAGCPAGALQQTTYPSSWTGRRILLRRGESFPSISLQDGNAGVQVGAFGTGTAKPRVPQVGIGNGRPRTAQFANDITVMDLEVQTSIDQVVGHRVLIYRNTIIGNRDSIAISFGGPGYWGESDPYRNVPANQFYNGYELFVVENTAIGTSSSNLYYGAYGSGSRIAFMGNVIGVQQQHTLRVWAAHKSVFSHNELRGVSADGIRHSFKLHSGGLTPYSDTRIDGRWASRHVVIANNVFGNQQDTNAWTVAICPENGESAQGIEDVIFESNRFHRGPNTGADLVYAVRRLTYRNNTRMDGGTVSHGLGHRAALPADWVGPFYGF